MMKHVLIIDESPLFREYLRLKLEESGIEVSIGIQALDGVTKMKNLVPDLIIMDSSLSRMGYIEVLKETKTSPNTINIPVILMTQRIDQKQLLELVSYNVKKVFTKPVKIDALFTTLSELLGVALKIDESPGIVEVHVNDNIIFIELAQGWNRDKLDLLHFKIIELIKLYEILLPKVIVMLSDMKLGYGDVTNLEKLLLIITRASKAKHKFIKILTMDDFAHKFINGHESYGDIKVVSNLHDAIDELLTELNPDMIHGEKRAEIIGDKVLSADNMVEEEAMQLKFNADSHKITKESIKESVQDMRIATVDDDFVIRELIKNSFEGTGAEVKTFSDGEDFLSVADTEDFDLVFLDLIMPKKDGFAVLDYLRGKDTKYPVIVLSSVTERDTVIRAFNMGIKSYLIKPLKPQDIFKKSMEILKPGF